MKIVINFDKSIACNWWSTGTLEKYWKPWG